jgi:hypothetical protein
VPAISSPLTFLSHDNGHRRDLECKLRRGKRIRVGVLSTGGRVLVCFDCQSPSASVDGRDDLYEVLIRPIHVVRNEDSIVKRFCV